MGKAIYRDFDEAALNREYNAAEHVGNIQAYFDEYNSRSADTRRELIHSRDVSYGPAEGEVLDIFFQTRRINPPVHIFFHGGGYRSQDKFNFSFVARPLVQEGAIVVIPNYGLCPVVTLDEIIEQTRRCIAWVYRHARVMGGDPNSITISGHSAGAHIVSRALEACWDEYQVPDDVIKGAISLSGLYDQEPRRLSYLNRYLRLDLEQSLRHSCMYRTPRRRVPYVIAVSDGETGEYIRQSRDYSNALKSRSYDATYMLVEGYNHYNVLYPFLDREHALGSLLYGQIFER